MNTDLTNSGATEHLSAAEPRTRFTVLLFTDIVDAVALKTRYGVPAFAAALQVNNTHFERLAQEISGVRIHRSQGDGYFAEADSVTQAVRLSLLFQDAMRNETWGEVRLNVRARSSSVHPANLSCTKAAFLMRSTWCCEAKSAYMPRTSMEAKFIFEPLSQAATSVRSAG
jgi:hypothetical protein